MKTKWCNQSTSIKEYILLARKQENYNEEGGQDIVPSKRVKENTELRRTKEPTNLSNVQNTNI